MRNQIKKMIKKENGFTLVELLAVLVILGIIVAIAIPAIGNIIDNAEDSASESEIALVEDAARLYFIENDGDEVTVQQLIDDGYLENLSDDSNISPDSKVVYDSDAKEYNIE
ncbi:competence type IV pilus major pilin ComGC [Marinilactibacillus psychrotolerans]|uniref:competence type IV pilus major pilin ComGC n=1 Tax=Marinilactibacillus psychrotolerans TaxID=191770 RepID=UPI003887DF6E